MSDRQKASLRFAGYAAIFDRLDNGGDIIRPGAFVKSLARARAIPLLWQHRPGKILGSVDKLVEDERGLRVIASVRSEFAPAKTLIRGGKVDGLSFGYRVTRSQQRRGVRELIELELLEISVVKSPMQPRARIHAVE